MIQCLVNAGVTNGGSDDHRQFGLVINVRRDRGDAYRVSVADQTARPLGERYWPVRNSQTGLNGVLAIVEPDADDLAGSPESRPSYREIRDDSSFPLVFRASETTRQLEELNDPRGCSLVEIAFSSRRRACHVGCLDDVGTAAQRVPIVWRLADTYVEGGPGE